MLKLIADERQLTARMTTRLTTDSVGLVAKLCLSEDFDGLAVTVCFRAGDVAADVPILDGTEITVPSQCFAAEGEVLYAGVYASNAEGTIVIPTVWAQCGTIRKGTLPSGVDPQGPEPDWTARVLQAAADAVATAQSVRDDADAGVFDGYSPSATVTQLEDGATIRITDKDGTTTATVHDGATGAQGPAGFSPTATVTQTATGATVTVTDQSGTTTADISNGAPGDTGATGPQGPAGVSPTASVQRVEGGAEVTVTDASGTTTAMLYDATIEAGSITDEMLAPDGIKQEHAWLWSNQITGELDGNPVTASDAHAAPMLAMGVLGASEQDTTTGKNLLDRSTEETGYINSSGNPGSSTDWRRSDYIPVVAGTTYTFTPNSTSGGSAYGCWYDADQGVLSTFPSGPTTQTAPTGAAYVRVSYRATSTNVQLEVGTAATAYEPYTGGKPTPRPDWPQEIRSAASPVLTVAGKNLLDPSLMLNQAPWHAFPLYAPEGTVLTMSTNHNTGSAGTAGDLPVYFRQPSGAQGTDNLVNYHHSVTQTVGEQGFVEVVQRRASGTDSFANYEWQIEVGDTATAYEPYQGNTVTLPVTLRSLPDGTKDELNLSYISPSTRAGWAWYSRELVQRADEVAMNSVVWQYYRDNVFYITEVALPNMRANNRGENLFCAIYDSYHAVGTAAEMPSAPNFSIAASSTTASRIYIRDSRYETAADFNAATTNAPFVYPLLNPVTTTLDPIELPSIIGPSCTVYATADATPTLNVEYVRDTNTVIASLEAAIADLATS